MTILQMFVVVVVAIVLVGTLLWLQRKFIPLSPPVQNVVNAVLVVVIVVVACGLLFSLVGLSGGNVGCSTGHVFRT